MPDPDDTRALYFPYIIVPESAWLVQMLLYWDTVGSIVPYEYIENPEWLGPYMQDLVHEQLVSQVHPGAYLWKLPNFAAEFATQLPRGCTSSAPRSSWSRVHFEKLEPVADLLVERGVAEPEVPDGYSPWYRVDPPIADLFMAYLATVLGQLPELSFVPVTDDISLLEAFRADDPERAAVRKILLEELLPCPAEPPPAGELAEFKSRHAAAARDLRAAVDVRLAQIMAVTNDEAREHLVRATRRELAGQLEHLAARMTERGWRSVGFSDLCAVVSASIGSAQAFSASNTKLGVATAFLGMAPAVWRAFRGSDEALRDQPLAYAALARSQFVAG